MSCSMRHSSLRLCRPDRDSPSAFSQSRRSCRSIPRAFTASASAAFDASSLHCMQSHTDSTVAQGSAWGLAFEGQWEHLLLACDVRLRLAGVVQTCSRPHKNESARQLHCMRVSTEPSHRVVLRNTIPQLAIVPHTFWMTFWIAE